jgi:ubiquinone/menaquinone biosynthesis C-methylase UbiE
MDASSEAKYIEPQCFIAMSKENKLPEGFSTPIAHTAEAKEQSEWQQRNRSWWQSYPMRYDWRQRIMAPEFSREFFEEIDRRHFFDAARYTPPRQRPFDELIPFERLPEWDVLEIGVGNGSHAQLIAPHCRSYVGIDLTDYAAQSTQRRFEIFDIKGDIRQMDAERMEFPDQSFDFIWTWGVIHHSSNTEQILREMRRVLRPGGRAVIMVYHRSFFYYYIFNGVFRGVIGGGLLKAGSLHKLVQLHTDGAIARFYTAKEWRSLVEKYFVLENLCIKGQKSELFPLPQSRFKDAVMNSTPNACCRLVLNTLRQGSFLISTISRS